MHQRENDAAPDLARLSEAKRRLLQKYLRGESEKERGERALICPRPPGEPVPLSFAQQQIWLHGQIAGDVPFYNESIAVDRQGLLDVGVLERCFLEIIRRHEIWRTTFEAAAGEPIQIVHPAPRVFPLPVTDLRKLPEAEREAEAVRLATEDAQRPFDLKTGPLMRALLVRMDDERYRLYMIAHQIISDAVSAYRVFLPELATLYEAFATGKPSPLPDLPIQYADFAYWQRKRWSDHTGSEHMAYWRRQLAGELSPLQWPSSRPRPSIETHRGAIQRFTLPADLVRTLRRLSQQEGVSLYMTLLAGFAALLHRYTGQEDIIVGGTTAGRKRAEVEPLLGCFINPLALRIDLSGNPIFRELLSRVRGVVLDALAHEDVPFPHIVRELRHRPDPSRNPLFQVILSQQPQMLSIASGWDLVAGEISNGGSKLDLMVVLDDRRDRIFGPVTYNPDLFDDSAITRMVGNWKTLLTGAAAEPGKHVAELPVLTDAEQDQIVVESNDTRVNYPKDLCLHALFEAQVERTPDATAVVCEEERLSYRELNARANQLAHHLRKLGVGAEVLVGICMERSVEMMVTLLGILKAGGAYVPLDPAYPEERLAFMIKDSGLQVLITHEPFRSTLSEQVEKLVRMDKDWPVISQEGRENPASEIEPENLAYVIYTSGSTGRPKGVQICHRSLVNLLTSMRARPGLTEEDSLLAVTTISFDIAALELYLPLMVGARCVLASRESSGDGQRLWKMLDDYEITVMQATPSTWKLLLQSGWPGKADLKILCGGEAMPRELAEQLISRACSVWNMYGPTETTVWSSLHRVTSSAGLIPIGRPIGNTQMYVLDRNMQPVPVGVIGELYIGGDGLARGYRNRAELNAEKFIPNPFGCEPGARLYKTGDVARCRADGNIECLWRVDNQVKVRGFRIELGEIESVLREHPAIRDVCVIVREDRPGDPRLVAYVVPAKEQFFSVKDLLSFVKEKLPSYMIPILVALERFPLTANGKLDRRALPAPDHVELSDDQSSGGLREPIEELLASIWTDVLKVERVGIYDNFFDLGGHSLLATQVVARLQEELGLRIKANELAFQTLGQLAASCKERLDCQ
jgi:amino acid adenylation domain-containing protein